MTGGNLAERASIIYRLPECVLFDLDGTLLDSLPGITYSLLEACRAEAIPIGELDLRQFIGPPIRTIFSRVLNTEDDALLDRLERTFRKSYDLEGWQKTFCYPGARDALYAMRGAGHRLFVVSNKPQHISIRILEQEGILWVIERVYNRDSRTPPYRSKEDMIRVLLKEQSLTPSDCVMVGDTMEDITASASNGIPTIFMQHGYGEAPSTFPAQMRANNFNDLRQWLKVETTE